MDPWPPLDPLEAASSFGDTLIQPSARGTYHVFAVSGIDSQAEEGLTGQIGRTRLEHPGFSGVVAANWADPPESWQSTNNPKSEDEMRVSLAGSDVNTVRVGGVNGDGSASQAGTGEVLRIDVKAIHQRAPTRRTVI